MLKKANKLPLMAVVAANVTAFVVLLQTGHLHLTSLQSLVDSVPSLLPACVGLALIGVLNAQLSPTAKAKIVYWRWSDPLPGSKAFTHFAKSDPRVDYKALEQLHGPLPTDPVDQNALWYRLYKSVDRDAAVQDSHGEYLFSRDYASFALLMLIVFAPIVAFQIDSARIAGWYVGGLALQCILTIRAARMHGRRLVTTVLAVAAAKG